MRTRLGLRGQGHGAPAGPAHDLAAYNEVYTRRFTEPYPVRTTVGGALASILAEVDVVAVRRDG